MGGGTRVTTPQTPLFGADLGQGPPCGLRRSLAKTLVTRKLSKLDFRRRFPVSLPVDSEEKNCASRSRSHILSCNAPRKPGLDPGSISVRATQEFPEQRCSTVRSAESAVTSAQRYRELATLGSGSFGTVRLAEAEGGKLVAVKKTQLNVDDEPNGVEASLLVRLKHPCIVRLIDSFESANRDGRERVAYLVMEYLPSTLHAKIAGSPLSASYVRCYGFQLMRALAHLTALNIAHLDIKPENLLVDGVGALKVADFGSAMDFNDEMPDGEGYLCSRWWRAPEVILGRCSFTTSVDWWSAGCVLVEMMRGAPVFRGASSGTQMDAIARVLGSPTPVDLRAMLTHNASASSGSDCGTSAGHGGCGSNRILTSQMMELAQPRYAAQRWKELLPAFRSDPAALSLVANLLVYDPAARITPFAAMPHDFFASLVNEPKLPAGIFEFTSEELISCTFGARELLLSWSKPVMEGVDSGAKDSQSSDSLLDTLRRPRTTTAEISEEVCHPDKKRKISDSHVSSLDSEPAVYPPASDPLEIPIVLAAKSANPDRFSTDVDSA